MEEEIPEPFYDALSYKYVCENSKEIKEHYKKMFPDFYCLDTAQVVELLNDGDTYSRLETAVKNFTRNVKQSFQKKSPTSLLPKMNDGILSKKCCVESAYNQKNTEGNYTKTGNREEPASQDVDLADIVMCESPETDIVICESPETDIVMCESPETDIVICESPEADIVMCESPDDSSDSPANNFSFYGSIEECINTYEILSEDTEDENVYLVPDED